MTGYATLEDIPNVPAISGDDCPWLSSDGTDASIGVISAELHQHPCSKQLLGADAFIAFHGLPDCRAALFSPQASLTIAV
jgi:hypothetical protein